MLSQPLVSIIIPTYNRAYLIGETLDSILAQTYANWECIIVDDGSTDDTDEVVGVFVEKDTRFKYYHRPETHIPGGNGARNYGFKKSKGEYVNWFDSDDIMLPEFLKIKITNINDRILNITSYSIVDYQLKNKLYVSLTLKDYLFKDYVLWEIKILLPSVFIKREFLNGFKLFNEDIIRGQETEFFSRIFYHLHPRDYAILEEETFLYRQHLETKSAKNKIYNPLFKTSKIYIINENLKRSLLLNDKELINFLSKFMINRFFSALKNNDKKNAWNILNEYPKTIRKIDRLFAMKFKIIGSFMSLTNLSSYSIEQYFRTYSL